MFQHRLPDNAFFSGPTAALLFGAPLPFHAEGPELDVTVPAPARAPHATGLTGHRRLVGPGDVMQTLGVRHSSAARTWCELAAILDLGDLVAVGDHLIHHRHPRVTRADLAARLDVGDRITRSPMLRSGLSLLDDRSESRPESKLRVILAVGNLPKPRVNHALVMSDDGGAHLRPDFKFRRERVILEYQGDYHRSKSQWRKDMTRRSRLEAAGWQVVELNADDLKDPAELCQRVRTFLARTS